MIRLQTMIFKDEFETNIDNAMRDADILEKGCETLRNNENFKKFLKTVLDLGNQLAQGTAKGGASGFKLGSLNSFLSTKSNRGSDILTYVVQNILNQKPEILEFTKDFDGVIEAASKVSSENPVRDMTALKNKVISIKPQLEASESANPQDIGFITAFKAFYEESLPRVIEAEATAMSIKSYYIETAKFLGEDDDSLKKTTSEEFFGIIRDLVMNIKTVIKVYERKKKAEARKAIAAQKATKK